MPFCKNCWHKYDLSLSFLGHSSSFEEVLPRYSYRIYSYKKICVTVKLQDTRLYNTFRSSYWRKTNRLRPAKTGIFVDLFRTSVQCPVEESHVIQLTLCFISIVLSEYFVLTSEISPKVSTIFTKESPIYLF